MQMLRLVRALAEQFDVILIDTPPVLTDSDTLTLTPNLENALLVIDARQTGRREARRAVRQLHAADAPLIGAALNRGRG
jgi:Mrp family chromosome partitioning ATPase